MSLHCKLTSKLSFIATRHYGAVATRRVVHLEPEVSTKANSKEISIRKHPGRLLPKVITVPKSITDAFLAMIGNTPPKAIHRDAQLLFNYIKSRLIPPEQREINKKFENITQNFDKTYLANGEVDEKLLRFREKHLNRKIKLETYHWEALVMDDYASLKYMVARGPANYAVLCRIFNEIKTRGGYTPTSYFDFGSGIGTGMWALTDIWNAPIKEYYLVDVSSEVHKLARDLLYTIYDKQTINENYIFQRQFLSSASNQYDLVLSAYSLFELPSAKIRLRTVLNLWKKTKDFLVLVEYGSNAGYKLICEARDFILETQTDDLAGHVFAPCPHDLTCPRYIKDNTPCNFEVKYDHRTIEKHSLLSRDLYSYVVLRKGKRPESEPQWPRIVRPVLPKSGFVICRMCCGDGKLDEITVLKSYSKLEYRCAKASLWGDLMPVKIDEIEKKKSRRIKTNESESLNDSKEQTVDDCESSNEDALEECKEK